MKLVVVLVLASVLGGCAGMDRAAVEPEGSAGARAYLFRGLGGDISRGLDRVADELRADGIDARVHGHHEWSALGRRMREGGPLVLIGHSFGADDAIRLSRVLERRGIAVDLLVTFDPVTPPAVPGNVLVAVNYYRSNPPWDVLPWWRGVPLVLAAGASGLVSNIDVRRHVELLSDPAGAGHATLDDDLGLRREVSRLVRTVLGG